MPLQSIISGRGSRVVEVSDRGLPCHVFDPSTTKDPPLVEGISVAIASLPPRAWHPRLFHDQNCPIARIHNIPTHLEKNTRGGVGCDEKVCASGLRTRMGAPSPKLYNWLSPWRLTRVEKDVARLNFTRSLKSS
ncbi:hypothetical protein TNCV_4695671 [Trichonephila clavipes]|nr:hypothetical protein TNCV_4695671 [Trichonephila clavipes]